MFSYFQTPGRRGFEIGVRLAIASVLAVAAAWSQFTIVPNPGTIPQGTRGVAYVGLGFEVTGAPTPPPVNYRLATGSQPLPPGLSINATNGNITGTPTQAGTFPVRVSVDDSSATPVTATTEEFTIEVVNPPLSISTSSPLPNGTVGVPYSTTVEATGGDGLTYTWTLNPGPLPGGLSIAPPGNTATITISGTPTSAGSFSFTLQVDDGDSATTPATKEFTITIGAPAPTLTQISPSSAPARRATDPAVSLTLTGTGFVDGAVVLFGTETLSATWQSATQLTASIPAAQLQTPGTVNVAVRNPDNQSSGTQTFTIQAVTPSLTSLSPSSAVAGSATFSLTLNGSNFLPGAVVLFGATPLTPAPGDIGPTQITVSVPAALVATPGSVEVRVRNLGDELSAAQTFTVVPVLQLSYPATITGTRDTAITPVNPTVTGGLGPFAYSLESGTLPDGLTLDPATGVISGTPTVAVESAAITVQVTDGSTPAQTATSQTITITINNPGLQIVTLSPLPGGVAGTAYGPVTLVASGGNGNYTWSVATGSSLPPGLSINAGTGAISGTPSAAGVFLFTLQVDDTDPNTAAVTRQFSLTVVPVISSLADGDGNNFGPAGGAGFTLSITGIGFSGDSGENLVTFGGTPLLVVSQGPTLIVAAVPASLIVSAGTRPVVVTTRDAASAASDYIVVGDTTLTITNDSALGARTAGASFSVDLEATGGNGNYTWSVAPGSTLPPGLSINAGTGVISGTLAQAGTFSFTIRVTDNATPVAATGQKTFTLTVQEFVVSTTSLPEARVGVSYSVTLAVSGGPTAPAADYQWTLVSGTNSLPPGITFSGVSGTISGTAAPISSPTQTFSIQVSARHTPTGLTTPVRSLQLVVAGGGLDISLSALPVGVVNQAYGPNGDGVTITPVNGTPPYTIEVSQASRTQLQAAGFAAVINTASNPPTLRIVGTPTIAGSIPVEITVRDTANTQVTRNLPLLVLANPLRIEPETLPSAVINTDYSQQLTVSGLSPEEQNVQAGQSAVTWTLIGNVPGLALNASTGLLTGRFTTLGTRQFTVQASTQLRQTTRIYSLSVESPRPSITTSTLPGATVGQAYSAEVVATGGTPGYTWQVTGVVLPAGLSFDATTVTTGTLRIAGTPAVGAQSRTFTLTVRDAAGQTASREFTIAVVSAPIPAITLQPFANPAPAEQKDVVVTLAQAYPIALQGTATLSFTPNATNNADDPAIRFLNGQRTANFTIPAGSTQAVFEGVAVQRVQTGTVAGTVRVSVSIQGGPSASQEFTVARSAPFLQDNLTLQSTANGFNVVITGYSTPRDLSSAQISFAPAPGTNLQTTQLTVPLTDAAAQWFQGTTGQANGSAFRLTIPFTVQNGSNAVASVTVTLSNSVGASNSRTRAF